MNKKLDWIRGEKTPVNKFLMGLPDSLGITEQTIYDRRQTSVSLNDALWSICNEYLLKSLAKKDSNSPRALYFQMERILLDEKKDTHNITRKRLMCDLKDYQQQGWPIVTVIGTDEACKACQKLDGKEYELEEAIKTQLLPPEGCTCRPCTCCY